MAGIWSLGRSAAGRRARPTMDRRNSEKSREQEVPLALRIAVMTTCRRGWLIMLSLARYWLRCGRVTSR